MTLSDLSDTKRRAVSLQQLSFLSNYRVHKIGNKRTDGRTDGRVENTVLPRRHKKLEAHSVERIYLRQRSSDGSVNKTILKPRLALAARR